MPCSVSQAEIDYYREQQREEWRTQGRYDLLATKSQLAGWLCDAMRGDSPTPEALDWFDAHRKHERNKAKDSKDT